MKVKVTPVGGKTPEYEPVGIYTENIRLDSFLKLANAAETGGEAKVLIQDGLVTVNGETCLMRGKKLYPGDRIRCRGQRLAVTETAHAD